MNVRTAGKQLKIWNRSMNKFSHILKAFPNLLNLNVLLALRNLLHRFFKHALCMFVLSTSHVFISQLRIIQTTYDYNTYNISSIFLEYFYITVFIKILHAAWLDAHICYSLYRTNFSTMFNISISWIDEFIKILHFSCFNVDI